MGKWDNVQNVQEFKTMGRKWEKMKDKYDIKNA